MKRVKNVIKECFSSIDTESPVLEIGSSPEWDSLGNLNLLMAIEEEFAVMFTPEEISTIKSYDQIVESLRGRNVSE